MALKMSNPTGISGTSPEKTEAQAVETGGLTAHKKASNGVRLQSRNAALKIARCALMGAMMIGVKAALNGLPNFEMVTLLIILFAVHFGREVFWAVAVFNLCELVYWGGGTWWVAYLYIWNLVALFAVLLRDKIGDDSLLWAAYSAVCGLFFGGLCSLVYIFIPDVNPWGYFLAGLPWDIVHGVCNFILMLALFKPLNRALQKISKRKNRNELP